MLPPFTSYFRWLSDQGQSSRTIVMRRPTKPQSQSCAGFTKSYKTNTNTAIIANTLLSLLSLLQSYHQHCHYCQNIALASLSQSHWLGTALRKMLPPFTSYFRWLSDQGQSSRTIVTLRPTKPQSQSCTGFTKSYKTNTNTAIIANTLLSLLSLLQSYHQHCHYCWNIA
jgi:hypothetical protein